MDIVMEREKQLKITIEVQHTTYEDLDFVIKTVRDLQEKYKFDCNLNIKWG
nr:MAG TPA: hypothetical protein [Caudoviricetes sp.]